MADELDGLEGHEDEFLEDFKRDLDVAFAVSTKAIKAVPVRIPTDEEIDAWTISHP